MLIPVLRRRSFLHLGTEVATHRRCAGGSCRLGRPHGAPAARAACEKAGADVVVALATAALRDADNGSRLIGRLERILGSTITLLTGEEEARLCFLGQRAGVWVGHDPVLGLDLGGGSLEAGIGTIDGSIAVASVALGTARIRGELGTGELLTPDDRRGHPEVAPSTGPSRSGPCWRSGPEAPATRVIASGGTVRALARLAMGLHRPLSPGARCPRHRGQPGGDPGRAAPSSWPTAWPPSTWTPGWPFPASRPDGPRCCPIGAVVLSTLVESLGLRGLVVSEWGLREGAVIGSLSLPADPE